MREKLRENFAVMSTFVASDKVDTSDDGKVFYEEKHINYIKKVASDTESFDFVVSQHLRMSGVYWGLTALCVLGIDINKDMDTDTIVDWAMSCQDESGGSVSCNDIYTIHVISSPHLNLEFFTSDFNLIICHSQVWG